MTNPDRWAALWHALHLTTIPQPNLPEVDFTRQAVLVIFAGEKRDSGFMIFVREIWQTEAAVIVEVAEQRAAPTQNIKPSPSYPFQIIRLPRPDRPVRFEFITPPTAATTES